MAVAFRHIGMTEAHGLLSFTGAIRNDNTQTFSGRIHQKGWIPEVMDTENNQRAGGCAETKSVEEIQVMERAGGCAETKDVEDNQETQKAGGCAETKGIEEV